MHAIRLHHDFTVIGSATLLADVRQLVALACVADFLVAQYEGVKKQREWEQHGPACLAYLQIGESELESWIDRLHPVFAGVVLA